MGISEEHQTKKIGNFEWVLDYWEFWKGVGLLGILKGIELLRILKRCWTIGNSGRVLYYWEFWKGIGLLGISEEHQTIKIGNSEGVLDYWEFWKGIRLLRILKEYWTIGNSENVSDYWELIYFTTCLKGCWQWQPHFKGN